MATQECTCCGKKYTKKSTFEKHKVLCDFLSKSKRERSIEMEEDTNLPTYKQLVNIVMDLTFRYEKLEQKMEMMKGAVKKEKINVLKWLQQNETIKPKQSFTQWLNTLLLNQTLFEHFMHNPIHENIIQIIQNNQTYVLPIQCFTQKQHMFYVLNDDLLTWRIMTPGDFKQMLQIFQSKLLFELKDWQTAHQSEILESLKICELYNKTIIKIMDINLLQNGKIRTELYNYLKKDTCKITQIIEFSS